MLGYIVVRAPSDNRGPLIDGVGSLEVPQVNGVTYEGWDRRPWYDLLDDYMDNNLPPYMRAICDIVDSDFGDPIGFRVLRERDLAEQVLTYYSGKEDGYGYEIIVAFDVYEVQGIDKDEVLPEEMEWIGCDIITSGAFSLLESGYYREPAVFNCYRTQINNHGLFDDPKIAMEYGDYYSEHAKEHNIEDAIDEVVVIGLARLVIEQV